MFAYLFSYCRNLAMPAVIKNNYTLPATITDLSHFFEGTYVFNTSLAVPIDLTPLKDWFYGNNFIENIGYLFNGTFTYCGALTIPMNLTPLKDWFAGNTSITNLSYFLQGAHSNNALLNAPIDITPLSGWFTANTSIDNLTSFLGATHNNNPSLILTGQPIFPDWIKTLKQGGTGTAIWNVSTSFSNLFALPSIQSGDTGEPKFQTGNVVLSSIGVPSSNKRTYTNRTSITPSNSNWK
jgi:hypothetical protein